MRCEQLMNTDVAFVRPSEDVRRAAMLMRSRNVGVHQLFAAHAGCPLERIVRR